MVNGLHLYSAFIQSAGQFTPLIHPFTNTFTHQWRLAAMQGTNQLVRSNWGLDVLLRDTSTRLGWDRTGNPPTARRLLLPPEPHRPHTSLRLLTSSPPSPLLRPLAKLRTDGAKPAGVRTRALRSNSGFIRGGRAPPDANASRPPGIQVRRVRRRPGGCGLLPPQPTRGALAVPAMRRGGGERRCGESDIRTA